MNDSLLPGSGTRPFHSTALQPAQSTTQCRCSTSAYQVTGHSAVPLTARVFSGRHPHKRANVITPFRFAFVAWQWRLREQGRARHYYLQVSVSWMFSRREVPQAVTASALNLPQPVPLSAFRCLDTFRNEHAGCVAGCCHRLPRAAANATTPPQRATCTASY